MILLSGKEGLFHVIGKDIQNVFQNIFKQRGKWRREVKKYVSCFYTDDAPRATNHDKIVIFMVDGRMHHGGLADRLKGVVSVYSVCRSLGIPVKIHFTSPFKLADFLVPNEVDWTIDEKDICYNRKDALPVFCGTNATHVEMPFQRRWFVKNFKKDFKQIHVYTNAYLEQGHRFKEYFNELFKMSPALEEAVSKTCQEYKDGYITVSCRFLALLGDFNEEGHKPLSPEKQAELLNRTKEEIEAIHNEERNRKLPILLMSDSIRCLEYITQELPYVHKIPGLPVHMDYTSDNHNNATHLKTFTDLMVISKAKRVYLLKSREMYNSGFPRIAALIGDRPLKLIRFMY